MARPILLAEDSKFDIDLVVYTIRQSGYDNEILVARDGAEAVALLKQEQDIGILILDIKLPILDGFEVLKFVRTTPHIASLPVIVLTASVIPSDRVRAELLGIASFLTKPYELAEFKTLVKHALAPFVSRLTDLDAKG